jgi:hypothetical protein
LKQIAILVFILLFSNIASANIETLDMVFALSTGNNKYEAKIKALDQAAFRAFLMIADKMNINDEKLNKVPLSEIKKLFSEVNIYNEKYDSYQSASRFQANIQFKFKHNKLNEFLIKYGSKKTQERFYEALVLPVYKINNKYILTEQKNDWLSLWDNFRVELPNKMLYLPKVNEEMLKFADMKKLLDYDYDFFADNLTFKLYKKIIFPVGEFFTDKETGKSILRVKYYVRGEEKNYAKEVIYNLPDKSFDLKNLGQQIYSDFTKDFGRDISENYKTELANKEKTPVMKILMLDPSIIKENKFKFNVELSYDEELNDIQKKLYNMSGVRNFDIGQNSDGSYHLDVRTTLDIENLSRSLYYSGLSYYYNNSGEPVLINILNSPYE